MIEFSGLTRVELRFKFRLGIAVLVMLFLSAAPAAHAANPVGPPGSWVSQFDDEFSGTALNTSNWSMLRGLTGQTPFGSPFNPAPAEDECFTDTTTGNNPNVHYGSGILQLILIKQTNVCQGDGVQYHYTSGMVQSGRNTANNLLPTATQNLFVETYMRVPQCSGCWPAFWLPPGITTDWVPEIDIAEFPNTGDPAQPRPYFNYHYMDSPGHRTDSGQTPIGDPATNYRNSTWHRYGMLWSPLGVLQIYVDGQLSLTYNIAGFDQQSFAPLFMTFDLAVEGGSTPPNNQKMEIDYARVWHSS